MRQHPGPRSGALTIEASTGGQIDAGSMRCAECRASASTGGEAQVHLTRAVRASASLGGEITVAGAVRNVFSSFGGSVRFD